MQGQGEGQAQGQERELAQGQGQGRAKKQRQGLAQTLAATPKGTGHSKLASRISLETEIELVNAANR